jgi:hypothetical protein
MTIKKLFEEGLTKDQLFDIMSALPEETLADIQWAAEVELMDRAYRQKLPALLKARETEDQSFAYYGS